MCKLSADNEKNRLHFLSIIGAGAFGGKKKETKTSYMYSCLSAWLRIHHVQHRAGSSLETDRQAFILSLSLSFFPVPFLYSLRAYPPSAVTIHGVCACSQPCCPHAFRDTFLGRAILSADDGQRQGFTTGSFAMTARDCHFPVAPHPSVRGFRQGTEADL